MLADHLHDLFLPGNFHRTGCDRYHVGLQHALREAV